MRLLMLQQKGAQILVSIFGQKNISCWPLTDAASLRRLYAQAELQSMQNCRLAAAISPCASVALQPVGSLHACSYSLR